MIPAAGRNIGDTGGACGVGLSPEEEMAIYDDLPPSLRLRLREASLDLLPSVVREWIDFYGEETVRGFLDDMAPEVTERYEGIIARALAA